MVASWAAAWRTRSHSSASSAATLHGTGNCLNACLSLLQVPAWLPGHTVGAAHMRSSSRAATVLQACLETAPGGQRRLPACREFTGLRVGCLLPAATLEHWQPCASEVRKWPADSTQPPWCCTSASREPFASPNSCKHASKVDWSLFISAQHKHDQQLQGPPYTLNPKRVQQLCQARSQSTFLTSSAPYQAAYGHRDCRHAALHRDLYIMVHTMELLGRLCAVPGGSQGALQSGQLLGQGVPLSHEALVALPHVLHQRARPCPCLCTRGARHACASRQAGLQLGGS